MLEGIASNQIIVGAYTNTDGICPMLAAHRAGGRTSLIAFAKAWDRFGFRDGRVRVARRATERELLILSTHLEASLLEDDRPKDDLASAIEGHRKLVARRYGDQLRDPGRVHDRTRSGDREDARTGRTRSGDRDRSRELRTSQGWAWTRVVRRYDDYERALAWLKSATGGGAEPSAPSHASQRLSD